MRRYAPYGTKELSDLALAGLGDAPRGAARQSRRDVLGPDLEPRCGARCELEHLARIYYMAICVGRPAILADEEIARIVERFKSYGGGAEAQKALAPPKKRARGKAKAAAAKRGAKKKTTHKKGDAQENDALTGAEVTPPPSPRSRGIAFDLQDGGELDFEGDSLWLRERRWKSSPPTSQEFRTLALRMRVMICWK